MSDKEIIIKLTILKKRIVNSNLNSMEKTDYITAIDEARRKLSKKRALSWIDLLSGIVIIGIWVLLFICLWGVSNAFR